MYLLYIKAFLLRYSLCYILQNEDDTSGKKDLNFLNGLKRKGEKKVENEQEEAQERKMWEFCIGKRYSWLGIE